MVSYPNQVHCTQIHVVSSQNCINWDYNKNSNIRPIMQMVTESLQMLNLITRVYMYMGAKW